jgi:hypothetical protein
VQVRQARERGCVVRVAVDEDGDFREERREIRGDPREDPGECTLRFGAREDDQPAAREARA